MSKIGVRWLSAILIVLFLMVLGVGCTKYPTEEELQGLERQRAAANSAEDRVEQLQREKAQLERQQEAAERSLQTAEREKQAVQTRLDNRSVEEATEGGSND